MSRSRSRQLAIGFLMILSLFVSSSAACICAHHEEKSASEMPSCHEHSETKQEAAPDEQTPGFESNDECCCAFSAPRVFSKSETIKFAKQIAVLPVSRVQIKALTSIVREADIYFEKPFYLSDSFYNIKSPRAPPAA